MGCGAAPSSDPPRGHPGQASQGVPPHDAKSASSSTRHTPELPALNFGHQPDVGIATKEVVTAKLDRFALENRGAGKAEMVFQYIHSRPDSVGNSQLFSAEVAYLFFWDEQRPILYDLEDDIWWVFDSYWKPSPTNLTRVKALYQTLLLPTMRTVRASAAARGVWPDKEPHG